MNIESQRQKIKQAEYNARHYSAPNMRAHDRRMIDTMRDTLASMERRAGIGYQLPLWLPLDSYNRTPVYDDNGRQTGWIF